ncbi:MAG TPA: winged helix-turn-helix domain-containing protein [Candidatus Acidoferrum sp.]
MTRSLQIGDWILTPELNRLAHGAETVRVEPKMTQVLLTLAADPGAVASKDELLRKVWPDTFVTEEVLTRSVSELRKIFKDNSKAPKYIETIPKVGYRLLVPVVALEGGVPAAVPVATGSRNSRRIAAAGVVVAAVVVMAIYLQHAHRARAAQPRILSLAVMPLANLSGDPGQDYFADSLTDELTTTLAKIGELRVASRASAMQYKNTRKSTPEIARELGVDAVVEGTVVHSGERVRITAQLINAATDRHLWAETYERDLRDILALQNDLAGNIARHIEITLTPDEKKRLAHSPAVDSRAYQLYLQGRYFWKKRTEYEKAIDAFQRSVESDASFAPAYSGLADSYLTKFINGGKAEECIPRAKAAVAKALELDPASDEAHVSAAMIDSMYDWDWVTAENEYKKAIELNPNSASAHQHYALFLALRRRPAEAKFEALRAQELDPVSSAVWNFSARVFYYGRDNPAAESAARRSLELDPDYAVAHSILTSICLKTGKIPEAFTHLETNLRLWGDPPQDIERLRRSYASEGMRGVWKEELRQGLQLCKTSECVPDDVATDYAWLGRNKESLEWWKRAVDAKSPWVLDLAVNPAMDGLRGEREYQVIAERVGFPE